MDVWRAGRTWKITVGEVRISPDNLNSICNGEAEGECQYRASNWNNDDQKRHLFIPFCKCIYDSIYIYIYIYICVCVCVCVCVCLCALVCVQITPYSVLSRKFIIFPKHPMTITRKGSEYKITSAAIVVLMAWGLSLSAAIGGTTGVIIFKCFIINLSTSRCGVKLGVQI